MFTPTDYELIDFGAGRKLERFGSMIVDRPDPAAEASQPTHRKLWNDAGARFDLSSGSESKSARGKWTAEQTLPESWTIGHESVRFDLKLANFGHVGVFPEQAAHWDWIVQQVGAAIAACGLANPDPNQSPIRLLNLFAYTGGSTLAAASAGAAVTHVDAAQNTVAWARRNAELSGLATSPIRWIADDALKFVRREIKRGQRYDGVILDPPSYGHGSHGEPWKLDEHLPELLVKCRELTGPHPQLVLLTCHARQYDPQRLAECLRTAGFTKESERIDAGDNWLTTADGRRLHCGTFVRIAKPQAAERCFLNPEP